MQIPKPTDIDKQRFRSAVPVDPRVEVRPMFGNLGAFVNGNTFAGLFGADIRVKLAPEDLEALAAAGGGAVRPGRASDDRLPDRTDRPEPDGVDRQALDHVSTLPAKKRARK